MSNIVERLRDRSNPYWPLPVDYADLTAEGQKLARLSVLCDQDTPEKVVIAWDMFRRLYLAQSRESMFYKKGFSESPDFHFNMVYDMAQYARNVYAAPRGSAKSTVITEEMSLLLSLTRPFYEITLGLSTEKLMMDRFDNIMAQLQNNELIAADFGNVRPKRGEALWNHGHLALTNGSTIRGLSVMGKKRGGRPKLFILDDPENDPDSDSESSRMAVIEKFEMILFKQIIPMLESESSIFWIGTLIDRKSFLYRATTGDDPRFDYWNRKVLKALAYDENDSSKVYILWPSKWPKDVLDARLGEIGPSAFCFAKGTPVRTYWGWESIDNLKEGDCIRDGNNDNVLVTKTFERTATDIVDIRLYGYDIPIRCTSDHPFLVFRETPYRNRCYNHSNIHKAVTGSGNQAKIVLTKPLWVNAGDLTKHDFCLSPIDCTEEDSPYFESKSRSSKMGYIKDGYLYTRVRSVTPIQGPKQVFDITTSGTFQVPGAVVHNCSEYLNEPVSAQDRILIVDPRKNEYTVEGELDWKNPLNHTGIVRWEERVFEEGSDHRIYKEMSKPFNELVRPMFRVLLFDYASGLTTYNDYSCIAIIGFDTLGTMWVLHMNLLRAKDAVLQRLIYETGLTWKPRILGIESVGIQKSFTEALQEYVTEQEQLRGDSWRPRVFPIIYPAKETKQHRIASLEWRFSSGRVKYPAHLSEEWPYTALYDQTRDFTMDLALLQHDDAIDTLAMSKYVVKTRGGKFRRERGTPSLLERIIQNKPEVKGLPLLSGIPVSQITDEMTDILSKRARSKRIVPQSRRIERKKPNIIL